MRKWSIIYYFVFIGLLLWVACTSMIYSFMNPSKTQTQAFLHITKSFILDFSGGVEQANQPDSGE